MQVNCNEYLSLGKRVKSEEGKKVFLKNLLNIREKHINVSQHPLLVRLGKEAVSYTHGENRMQKAQTL